MLRTIRLVRVLFPVTFLIVALFIQVVQPAEYEGAIVSTVDAYVDANHVLRMGRGNTFFALNRSWLFYVEAGSWIYYSSSSDGESWTTYLLFQTNIGKFGSRYDAPRNLIHTVYAPYGGFQGLYYRRGTPYPNGTIIWDIQSTISTVGYIDVVDIDVDSNGYVYALYENASQIMANKNANNATWTWSNDAGFPYWVNQTGNWALRPQINVLANNNVQFLYAHITPTPTTTIFSRIYCANNSTWNAQVNSTRLWCGAGGQAMAFSSVVRGNDVYLMYLSYDGLGSTTERLLTYHNYTTLAWDYMNEIWFGGNFGGNICYDSINDRIYFLGMETSDDSAIDIIYWNPQNSTPNYQENIEEYTTLNNQYWGATKTVDPYGRMGIAWCQTNYPPFVLRFAWVSPDLSIEEEEEEEEDEPLPDFLSMYIHLGLMIFGLLMMFFAVIWLAWGFKKKGLNEVTLERGGYSMLLFFVGFAMLMGQLYSGAG